MGYEYIKIPRSSDKTIADFYFEIGKVYKGNIISCAAYGNVQIGAVNVNTPDENKNWVMLLNHNSYLIYELTLRINAFDITYLRGGQKEEPNKSSIYDEIRLADNGNNPLNFKLNVITNINKKLRPLEPDRFIPGIPTEESNLMLSIHNSTLEKLEQLSHELIVKNTEFRLKLESDYDQNTKVLKQELVKDKDVFEQQISLRKAELEVKSKEIQETLKKIDNSNNTHARRAIRDKMLNDVKERISQFGVSKSTANKRMPILIGLIILFLSFVSLFMFTTNELASIGTVQTNIYLILLRLSLYSFGAVGTLLYYIKWQNKWAEQHSNSEFQLQQFYIDVNRANWVVESCLEWQKETKTTIPSELLESITNNLFININSEPEKVIHPSDELASALMGSASKVKLKLGESEVDILNPKKNLKNLNSDK